MVLLSVNLFYPQSSVKLWIPKMTTLERTLNASLPPRRNCLRNSGDSPLRLQLGYHALFFVPHQKMLCKDPLPLGEKVTVCSTEVYDPLKWPIPLELWLLMV